MVKSTALGANMIKLRIQGTKEDMMKKTGYILHIPFPKLWRI